MKDPQGVMNGRAECETARMEPHIAARGRRKLANLFKDANGSFKNA